MIYSKVQPKRLPKKLWGDIIGLVGLASGGLPNIDEAIGCFQGASDGTMLQAQPGNHTGFGQMKGSAFLGDGTNHGTLSEVVTLVGNLKIEWEQTDVVGGMVLGTNNNDSYIYNDPAGHVRAQIATLPLAFTQVPSSDTGFTLERVGDQWTLSSDQNSQTITGDTGDFLIAVVGAYGAAGSLPMDGNLWDLKAEDSTGPKIDLPMICIGSGTEWSSTAGLPDCEWGPNVYPLQLPVFDNANDTDPGPYYEVFTDGRGSNRANVDGFSVGPQGEELVVNGTFDENIDGWTDGSSGNSYIEADAGTMLMVYVDETVRFNQGFDTTIGQTYTVTMDKLETFADSVGSTPGAGNIVAGTYGTGSVTRIFEAVTTTSYVNGYGSGGRVDNISVKQGVPGIQPAARVDPPQYPGPIAADMTLGGIGIQGDGVRYVELGAPITLVGDFRVESRIVFSVSPDLQPLIAGESTAEGILGYIGSTNDRLFCWIGSSQLEFDNIRFSEGELATVTMARKGLEMTVTKNTETQTVACNAADVVLRYMFKWGGSASEVLTGDMHYTKIFNASDELVHHYHMEDGNPGEAISKVEDVKGGNHGTLIDASPETAWVQTQVGPCYRMAGGFNIDAIGQEPVNENYDFTEWSGDDPVGWTVLEEDANNYVTQDTGGCRLVSDNTTGLSLTTGPLVVGDSYQITIIKTKSTSGFIRIRNPFSGSTENIANSDIDGVFTLSGVASIINFRMYRDPTGNTDYVLSEVVIRRGIPGYSCEDMNNPGYDVNGLQLEYSQGEYDTFINADVPVQGSLGPETQALTSWTGEQWHDIETLPFNVDDQEFYCDKGHCLYREVQDAATIVEIANYICTAAGAPDNVITNGTFTQDDTGWDVGAGWIIQSFQALGSTVSNGSLLKQTVDPLFTPGQPHILRYEITSVNFGQLEAHIGSLVVPLVSDALGFHQVEVTPPIAGSFSLTAVTAQNWNGAIDNISLRLVP